jgi:N-acylneuraminate cytidylyltransferase/CMP-N,N'-diacetyllegionaminic acid synthase
MVKKIPAIIPARGGSKGLPRKNILELAGKPLIAWTIEAALNSKYISEVIVSTDDEEIAEFSRKYGAQIPFMRPKELATDDSIAIDTYLYTIEKLNLDYNKNIEEFVVLQPTSPLRASKHIDEAIELFFDKNADSVLSFYENPHPTDWLKVINKDGYLRNYEKSTVLKNRQECKKTYLPNGAILIPKYSLIKKHRTYYFEKTIPYLMDQRISIDIDTLTDFLITECMLEKFIP